MTRDPHSSTRSPRLPARVEHALAGLTSKMAHLEIQMRTLPAKVARSLPIALEKHEAERRARDEVAQAAPTLEARIQQCGTVNEIVNVKEAGMHAAYAEGVIICSHCHKYVLQGELGERSVGVFMIDLSQFSKV
jgi:hypothetical protein